MNIRTSNGEFICKLILKQLLPKYNFKCIKPANLINPLTGCCMELDFYDDEYKTLAFEYQGWLHYLNEREDYNPEMRKKIVEYDHIKKDLCKQLGIHLIEIPFTLSIYPFKLRKYLYDEITKLGYKCEECLNDDLCIDETDYQIDDNMNSPSETDLTKLYDFSDDLFSDFKINEKCENCDTYIGIINKLMDIIKQHNIDQTELKRTNKN